MKLSYTDFMSRKKRTTKATVTTDHSASHYGIPVIVLPDGGAVDQMSWALLGYKVVKCSQEERVLLAKVFENFKSMFR